MSKKIALIEDDPVMRESVSAIILAKTNYRISYSCGSVEEFIKLYTSNDIPDIMLLDIGLPGVSGIEGLPHILDEVPNLDVIMLSTYEEADDIYQALVAGACSYVSKRSSPQKVIDAINIVAAGGAYMSPSIAKKVSMYFNSINKKKKVDISNRQREIVNHLINGTTLNEIADLCFISHNTVKTHVKRIYQLLKINNRADLLKKYYEGEI